MPADPVSVAVALADKIDTLVGFWAIDEKPTGIKDPYALRRAALGVIRIVSENNSTAFARIAQSWRACRQMTSDHGMASLTLMPSRQAIELSECDVVL